MDLDERIEAARRDLRVRLAPDAPDFEALLRRRHRARAVRRSVGGVLAVAVALGIVIPLAATHARSTITLHTAAGTGSAPGARPSENAPNKALTPLGIVTVPNVVGQDKVQAMQTLQQVDLDIALVGQVDPAVPLGVIVSQNPAPGTLLERGSQVTVTVSSDGVPLDRVDWAGVSYPVSCDGTPAGTVAGHPDPMPGHQLAVLYVQCAHGAGSPPSAVLVYDYATSSRTPHLFQTLLTYQDDWSPAPKGFSATGSHLSIHVYGYSGSAPRCCPNIDTTLYWSWTGSSYRETSSEPTHATLPK